MVFLGPSVSQRRGWEWCEESWPRGVLTPVRSDKAVVGKIGDFVLTQAKLARRWGGGGREDYGEALSGLGNAFLPRCRI